MKDFEIDHYCTKCGNDSEFSVLYVKPQINCGNVCCEGKKPIQEHLEVRCTVCQHAYQTEIKGC